MHLGTRLSALNNKAHIFTKRGALSRAHTARRKAHRHGSLLVQAKQSTAPQEHGLLHMGAGMPAHTEPHSSREGSSMAQWEGGDTCSCFTSATVVLPGAPGASHSS